MLPATIHHLSINQHCAATDNQQHWIEVDWKKHPDVASGKSHDAIEEEIFLASVDHGSLVSRGSWFKAESERPEEKMFFRATFAAASADQIDEAIKRFGDALRAQFKLS